MLFVLFRNAFSVEYIYDDYFFLKIGKATSLAQFLNFFSPVKTYFYRPLPTETFYFLINIFHLPLFVVHLIGFGVYFLGLIYLFKTLGLFTKNKLFIYCSVFLYAINFIRVFQLYEIATYIELFLFVFLIIATYYFFTKRFIIAGLFFIAALMTKESALLWPLFLCAFPIIRLQRYSKSQWVSIALFILVAIGFYFLQYPGASAVTKTESTYALQKNPRLIANNVIWYSLWTLGFPNYLPNTMTSLFPKPLPQFWNLLQTPIYKQYLYSLLLYLSLIIPSAIIVFIKEKSKKQFCCGCYFSLGRIFFLLPPPHPPYTVGWCASRFHHYLFL